MSKVLTGPGGEFEVNPKVRELLAYFDDGRLLISKTHVFNVHVRAFQQRLTRLGQSFTPTAVDMQVIAQHYEEQAAFAATTVNTSTMQADAMDLFRAAVEQKASDIHVRVSRSMRTRIFFRVHNRMEFFREESFDHGVALCTAIYHAMADVSDAVFEPLSRQDGRIGDRNKLPAGVVGIRIATAPTVDGNVMVLRMLYNRSDQQTLKDLGYLQRELDAINFVRRRPSGINIMAGPTGAGKSTSLSCILNEIHFEGSGRYNIITVEDPPEYPMHAVQTPVTDASTEEERSREFQAAIKNALRLDPDVIMIGEIRDRAAAHLAIEAALTGHQVWTTLHANSAMGCIDRLVDLGVPREMISDPSVLSGLICQRLVPLLCPHCKQPLQESLAKYTAQTQSRILGAVRVHDTFTAGAGCDHCRGRGVVGRVAIAEVIVPDQTLMGLVREGNKRAAYDYWKTDQQGKTMADNAIELINRGLVDPFDAEAEVGHLSLGRIESDHRISALEITSHG